MSFKVAIVGTGKVARSNYLPYLAKQPDITLSYYSRTFEKAEACARDFGGQAFASIEALLGDEPDTILVLTHETQRAEAIEMLLTGKPKRLFFEKPLVAKNGQANVSEGDFLQARALLQRAETLGCETAMVFNYRFFEQTQRALKILEERDFGRLTQATLLVNYACWSHCIDLLNLFGGRAVEISALAGNTEYQGAVDVSGAFRLENGATGTILGTSGTKFDHALYELHFSFERGSLHFSDLDGPLEIYDHASRYKETHGLIGNHSRWDQYQASFEKSLTAYLDSIRQSTPPPISGLAGLEELQFEAALRRSIAQRRPVNVQEELPLLLAR